MMAAGIKRKPGDGEGGSAAAGSKEGLGKTKKARLLEKKRKSRVIKVGNNDEKKRRGPDLPGQLGVDSNLEAHAQEIASLRAAMARAASKEGSNVRAWQMLPRHARRRNASHNLLALPKRLRSKGRAELRASKTEPRSRAESRHRRSAKGRSSLGAYPRRVETRRHAELVQRALRSARTGKAGAYSRAGVARRANAWLETHLWHAKRFRMSSLRPKVFGPRGTLPSPTLFRWGFSLAEEPSLKSHRASWRAQKARATVMDRSYESWIRIDSSAEEGEMPAEEALGRALAAAGILDGWQPSIWGAGTRYCETTMMSFSNEERGKQASMSSLPAAQAPVQVMWIPGQDRKPRRALLKTHPANIDMLFGRVKRACQTTKSNGKVEGKMVGHLQVTRLNSIPSPVISAGSGAKGRRHGSQAIATGSKRTAAAFLAAMQRAAAKVEGFNTFEITGPQAGPLLASVLRLPKSLDKVKKEVYDVLASRHPKIEAGTVMAFDVHDPRLSYPPKKRAVGDVRREGSGKVKKSTVNGEPDLARGRLFTHGATLPIYTKGEIDSRRAHLAVPGSRLLPSSSDDVVPVVVLCGEQNRFTLIVPRGWGRPFWLSLAHGDPGTVRVIGQIQSRSLQLDAGSPCYPQDWTGTAAGRFIQDEEASRAQAEWSRRPPAKRVNYDRAGIRFPWGGRELWETCVANGSRFERSRGGEEKRKRRAPWMLATSSSLQLGSGSGSAEQSDQPQGSPVDMGKLVERYVSGGEEAVRLDFGHDISRALVCVRVTACRKGAFGPFAEIHHLREKDAVHWRETLEAVEKQKEHRDEAELHRLESKRAAKDTLVGAVTTGDYSLSRGRGQAIASISLIAWLDLVKRDATRGQAVTEEKETGREKQRNPIPLDKLVIVRNVDGGVCRAASLDLIHLA